MTPLLVGLGAFVLGAVFGAVLTNHIWTRTIVKIVRLEQTGSIEESPESRTAGTPHNPEQAARRRISEDAIERGAQHIIAVAKESGVIVTPRAARRQAAEMLASSDPLGGVT